MEIARMTPTSVRDGAVMCAPLALATTVSNLAAFGTSDPGFLGWRFG
jgi:hypothetical protein